MSETDSQRFSAITENFLKICLVPKGTFWRFLTIFLDSRQKWQKLKNIEFRAPTSTAIALKVFIPPRGDKSESEKKYAGVAKPYPADYSRILNLAHLNMDGVWYPRGTPRPHSIFLIGMFHYISSHVKTCDSNYVPMYII